MTVSDLLLPVFVQVGLTFFLMFWMGLLRREALNSGAVKPAKLAPAYAASRQLLPQPA